MKRIIILSLAVLLSGCAGSFKEAAEKAIKKAKLKDRVTMVCYDYYDKQECPKGSLQRDIDVLPFVPGTSRFCLGVPNSKDAVTPAGMYCYSRDIIK